MREQGKAKKQRAHLEYLGHSHPQAPCGGQVVGKRTRAPAIPSKDVGHEHHAARSGCTGICGGSGGGGRSD
jgi:hypothetical protein